MQNIFSGTCTVFADSLHKAINKRLTVPTKTRWNSFYDSLVVLNKVLEEKKDQLQMCMNQQKNLTMFVQKDIDFMSEYATVNKLKVGRYRVIVTAFYSFQLMLLL